MADEGYATGRPTPPATPTHERKGFVERAWDVQHRLEQRTRRFGSGRYARVLKMARKPEPDEYRRTATIVAIGLLVIGLIGFLIYLFMDWMSDTLGIL